MNKPRAAGITGTVLLSLVIVTAAVAQTLRPAPVLHDLAGRDDCLMCHQMGAMEVVTDVPETHAGWQSGTCLWCHHPDSPMRTIEPPTIKHDTAGRDDCLMCHAPGAMEPVPDTPESHEGRESTHCGMCHHPAD
jgi:hypothetical protein